MSEMKSMTLIEELNSQLEEAEVKAKIFEARASIAQASYQMKLLKLATLSLDEKNYLKHLQMLEQT